MNRKNTLMLNNMPLGSEGIVRRLTTNFRNMNVISAMGMNEGKEHQMTQFDIRTCLKAHGLNEWRRTS